VAHPKWSSFVPLLDHDPANHPRVITFICKDALSGLTVIPIEHLSHYDTLGLSLSGMNFNLHLINFYHHVRNHEGNLRHLLDLSLDHSIPILLAGDFNTHFGLWSPSGKRTSLWSDTLESWLDSQGFLSTVPNHAISRVSLSSHPSLINFIFVNEAFLEHPHFPCTCLVSFGLSLSSDHAALLLSLPISMSPKTRPRPPGWIVDVSKKDTWISNF
jgi:Endonuclease-reverse transcriptase